MIEMFFHTIINILWITILTAVAAIAISVAYVAVKVVFCKEKGKDARTGRRSGEAPAQHRRMST